MDLGPALQVMIQFTIISTIVFFAYDTAKDVIASPGWDDNIKAIIGLIICFVWGIDLVTVCAGNAAVYEVGPVIGTAITGIAFGGGIPKLAAKLKANVTEVKEAAA